MSFFKTLKFLFIILVLSELVYIIFMLITIFQLLNNKEIIGKGLLIAEQNNELGYCYKPNSRGYFLNPNDGVSITVFIDKNGRRNSINNEEENYCSDFMFFGCSYTFGEFINYDSTYSKLISKNFNANCLNFGISGQGLAQMLILLKKHEKSIDSTDVIFIQNSKWLVQRSILTKSRSYPFPMYVPYFGYKNGQIILEKPLFKNNLLGSSVTKLIKKNNDIKIFLLIKTFTPIIIKGQLTYGYSLFYDFFRNKPPKDEVIKYFYKEVQETCSRRKNYLVIVGMNEQDSIKLTYDKSIYVDTEKYLQDQLNGLDYNKIYKHVYKNQVFDFHPNNTANRRMYEIIKEKMNEKYPKQFFK